MARPCGLLLPSLAKGLHNKADCKGIKNCLSGQDCKQYVQLCLSMLKHCATVQQLFAPCLFDIVTSHDDAHGPHQSATYMYFPECVAKVLV